MEWAVLLSAVGFSLGVSALCSLLESTLLSLTPGQVAELKKRRRSAGLVWERFKGDIEKPISVILICNTAAHTIGATVAGAEFEKIMEANYGRGGWSVLIFGVVFTFLMLQFTEILPKTLGVRFNRQVAAATAGPMSAVVTVMKPVLWAINRINRPIERLTGGRGNVAGSVSAEEIATLAAAARVGRIIDVHQERMIKAAAALSSVRVRQVMTPRHLVRFLRDDDSLAKALHDLRDRPYTRLPVCRDGDLDKIVGVIHLRDLLPDPAGGAPHEVMLTTVARPATFVPENQSLDKLLEHFRRGSGHLAVVVDEYGSTQGVVTLEDVLEEIVGDIEDEFDEGEHVWKLVPLRRADNGAGAEIGPEEAARVAWRSAGDVPLREVIDRLGIHRPADEVESVVTVGGYVVRQVMKQHDRWPRPGDKADLGEWRIVVRRSGDGRVDEVVLLPPKG